MDETDIAILRLLQSDARLPYADIGVKVGLASSSVTERIKKLTAQKTLKRWTVQLDHDALGFGLLAFVMVLIDQPKQGQAFIDRLKLIPEIQECHHVTGEWSYLLKIRTQSIGHLESLLSDNIQTIKGVSRTMTTITLSTPKETGLMPF